jgi:hypothetical protein
MMSKFYDGMGAMFLVIAAIAFVGWVGSAIGAASKVCAPPVAPWQCEVVGDEVHCVAPAHVLIGVGE